MSGGEDFPQFVRAIMWTDTGIPSLWLVVDIARGCRWPGRCELFHSGKEVTDKQLQSGLDLLPRLPAIVAAKPQSRASRKWASGCALRSGSLQTETNNVATT